MPTIFRCYYKYAMPPTVLTVASAEYLARLIQTQVYPGLFRRIVLDFLAAGEATVTRYELDCFSGKESSALSKKWDKS